MSPLALRHALWHQGDGDMTVDTSDACQRFLALHISGTVASLRLVRHCCQPCMPTHGRSAVTPQQPRYVRPCVASQRPVTPCIRSCWCCCSGRGQLRLVKLPWRRTDTFVGCRVRKNPGCLFLLSTAMLTVGLASSMRLSRSAEGMIVSH